MFILDHFDIFSRNFEIHRFITVSSNPILQQKCENARVDAFNNHARYFARKKKKEKKGKQKKRKNRRSNSKVSRQSKAQPRVIDGITRAVSLQLRARRNRFKTSMDFSRFALCAGCRISRRTFTSTMEGNEISIRFSRVSLLVTLFSITLSPFTL